MANVDGALGTSGTYIRCDTGFTSQHDVIQVSAESQSGWSHVLPSTSGLKASQLHRTVTYPTLLDGHVVRRLALELLLGVSHLLVQEESKYRPNCSDHRKFDELLDREAAGWLDKRVEHVGDH